MNKAAGILSTAAGVILAVSVLAGCSMKIPYLTETTAAGSSVKATAESSKTTTGQTAKKAADSYPDTKIIDGKTVNLAYNDSYMTRVDGKKADMSTDQTSYRDQSTGFGLQFPDSMKTMTNDRLLLLQIEENAITLDYLPEKIREAELSASGGINQDELQAAIKDEYEFCSVIRTSGDNTSALDKFSFAKDYSEKKKIVTLNKDTYYFLYNTEYHYDQLSQKDKEDVSQLTAALPELENSLMVFPAVSQSDTIKGSINLTDFETTDLNGNKVTQDIFKDYDVTMINVWATWCGPCMGELPEIQAIVGKLPERTQIISVCSDASDDPDYAADVVKKEGLTYPVLKPDDSLNKCLLDYIEGFPTTLFADSQGKLIGEPIIGVPKGNPGETYLQTIKDRQAGKLTK